MSEEKKLNEDGLEAGAPVDFATLQRVLAEHAAKTKETPKPAKPTPKPTA